VNAPKRKPFTSDELATSLGLPRSFDRGYKLPTPEQALAAYEMQMQTPARTRTGLFNGAPWAGLIASTIYLGTLIATVLA
jgi:hypothetical protein